MPKTTKEQVKQLAEAAGLQIDDARAEAIESRLSGVLDELEGISDEDLDGIEPLPVFLAGGAKNG